MRPHHPTHMKMHLWENLLSTKNPETHVQTLGYDDSIDLLTVCYYMEHDEYISLVESHLRSLFDD